MRILLYHNKLVSSAHIQYFVRICLLPASRPSSFLNPRIFYIDVRDAGGGFFSCSLANVFTALSIRLWSLLRSWQGSERLAVSSPYVVRIGYYETVCTHRWFSVPWISYQLLPCFRGGTKQCFGKENVVYVIATGF